MNKAGALVLAVVVSACGHAPPAAAPSAAVARPVEPAAARVVRGTVKSESGAALVAGHARLLGLDGKTEKEIALGADGTFSLPLPGRRVAILEVGGVNHRPSSILVSTESAVDVDVRLGASAVAKTPHPTVIVYRDAASVTDVRMKEHDGVFTADVAVADGDYSYEIAGVLDDGTVLGPTEGRPVHGTEHYRAPLHVTGSKASITLDPAKLPPAGEATITAGPSTVSRRLAGVSAAFAHADHTVNGKGIYLADPGRDAWERRARIAREALQSGMNDDVAIVRQASTMAYFAFGSTEGVTDAERGAARRFVAEVAPDDAVWSFGDGAERLLVAAEDPTGTDAFIAKSPNTETVARVLLGELRRAKNDLPRARALVAKLKDKRFEGTMGQQLAAWSDPDRLLAPGKPMPSFEVPALVGAALKGTHSSKAFADKVYLVELWATWCVPCVAELPKLHALYARYGSKKEKPFEILSISLDEKPETVAKFRADKAHPMPWAVGLKHDDESAGSKAFFADTFGLKDGVGVPFYVLVDHGKIVATTPDLHPDALPALLDALR